MIGTVKGYSFLQASIGWIAVVDGDDSTLHAVLIAPSKETLLAVLSIQYPGALLMVSGAAGQACTQLEEYFAGRRRTFQLNLDWSGISPFTLAIFKELARIPFGETLTYGELASRSGYPGAARAVGRVMANNRLPLLLPCHRIVGRGGALTGYSGGEGIKTKQWLLDFERRVLHENI